MDCLGSPATRPGITQPRADPGERFADVSGVSGLDSLADGRVFVLWDYNRDGAQDIAHVNANFPLLSAYENRITAGQEELGNLIALRFEGGNRTWNHAGRDMNTGFDRATTEANDVWYKPYDHGDEVAEQHMRDYLTWEIALVEQLDRDPTVNFVTYD